MKKLFTLLAISGFTSLGLSQELKPSAVTSIEQQGMLQTVIEQCSDFDMYTGADMIYVGDFTTYFIANLFEVPENTNFTFDILEMYPTVPTGSSVDNAIVEIYTNVDGLPGELVTQATVEVNSSEIFQQINFTSGETADELLVSYDISSLGDVPAGQYWVAISATPSSSPIRYATQLPQDEYPSLLLRDSGWGPLATSTNPDTPIEIPYTILGDCSEMTVSDLNSNVLSIYPNPANDVLNISLKNAEIQSVSISNLSGQIVSTTKSANSVNISTLPTGVYVVKVLDNKGKTHVSKVVVK